MKKINCKICKLFFTVYAMSEWNKRHNLHGWHFFISRLESCTLHISAHDLPSTCWSPPVNIYVKIIYISIHAGSLVTKLHKCKWKSSMIDPRTSVRLYQYPYLITKVSLTSAKILVFPLQWFLKKYHCMSLHVAIFRFFFFFLMNSRYVL